MDVTSRNQNSAAVSDDRHDNSTWVRRLTATSTARELRPGRRIFYLPQVIEVGLEKKATGLANPFAFITPGKSVYANFPEIRPLARVLQMPTNPSPCAKRQITTGDSHFEMGNVHTCFLRVMRVTYSTSFNEISKRNLLAGCTVTRRARKTAWIQGSFKGVLCKLC